MNERLIKERKENPNFDKELVNFFASKMPDLFDIYIEGKDYDDHIGTKDIAKLAQKYITNNKGDKIGFKWDYETVLNMARSYIDMDQSDFYPTDIWVWANVKYGDMSEITTEPTTIIRYAISELTDEDYPFGDPSTRAYCWLKKHIENAK